ncbi:MAG: TIGR03364 family FAD-dependent oxidoreductase [Rhodothermales bacterium]
MPHLVIIGAGIAGLAHAVAGLARGWRVSVIERSPKPRGASTQNFGMVWPIGQALGPRRARALRSRAIWKALSRRAGFAFDERGTLLLAYTPEALAVAQEFAAQTAEEGTVELLDPARVARMHPAVRLDGLQAGVFSSVEARVSPTETLGALITWLAGEGVRFHFGSAATAVHPGAVETSDGVRHPFDRCLICSGDDTTTLFPRALAEAGCSRIRLQMLRTAPMPSDWRLGPALASELSMAFYASFAGCPSISRLQERLHRREADALRYGIHVLAVQDAAGALVIGDSHTDDTETPAAYSSAIERLILGQLDRFLDAPLSSIESRWLGHYLRAPAGQTHVRLAPAEGVEIVTGLGGGGMTLSFALAEETLDNVGPAIDQS